MKKLTVQQAIEQGYTHWLYPDEGWQGLRELTDIQPRDFEKGEIHLSEKQSYSPTCYIDEDQILDMIGERIWEQHSDETGCDDDEITDKVSSIDVSVLKPLMDAINEKLGTINYYRQTDIQLIPPHQ